MTTDERRPRYFTTQQLIARGWSRTMIKKFLSPDEIERFTTSDRKYVVRFLYLPRSVAAKERSKKFKEAKVRYQRRLASATESAPKKGRVDRSERFARKYPTLASVLPDACHAMFNLNRYAKYYQCTEKNASEIYSLKESLVRMLYALKKSVECTHHNVPAKKCYACDGTGSANYERSSYHYFEESDDDSDDCGRCSGTGYFRQKTTLVSFRFVVADQEYCWHLPKGSVKFDYKTNKPGSKWEEKTDAIPLSCKRAQLTDAKALVDWAVWRGDYLVEMAEEIAKNLAWHEPVQKHPKEQLRDKLFRYGDPYPYQTESLIRSGVTSFRYVIDSLRQAKRETFLRRIRDQLAFKMPNHKRRGPALEVKLRARLPKHLPYKTYVAACMKAHVVSKAVTFRVAVESWPSLLGEVPKDLKAYIEANMPTEEIGGCDFALNAMHA